MLISHAPTGLNVEKKSSQIFFATKFLRFKKIGETVVLIVSNSVEKITVLFLLFS